LWLLGWATGLNAERSEILDYFSMLNHFQKLQSGLIDSKDICFYLLFTATFLILSIRQLENDRLQK
jgi:ABC-2 type transport system permease protein